MAVPSRLIREGWERPKPRTPDKPLFATTHADFTASCTENCTFLFPQPQLIITLGFGFFNPDSYFIFTDLTIHNHLFFPTFSRYFTGFTVAGKSSDGGRALLDLSLLTLPFADEYPQSREIFDAS